MSANPGEAAKGTCPACDEPLFGWVLTSTKAPYGPHAVIDRCENCGLAATRGLGPIEINRWLAEMAGLSPGDLAVTPEIEFSVANIQSLQAGLGEGRWSGLDPERLIHINPRAAKLLLRKVGFEVTSVDYPKFGPNMLRFWQTSLNAVTFNPNFAREVKAGRLHPHGVVGRFQFGIDALITLLAGLLVSPLIVVMELVAAAFKRGGQIEVSAARLPKI